MSSALACTCLVALVIVLKLGFALAIGLSAMVFAGGVLMFGKSETVVHGIDISRLPNRRKPRS